MKQASFKLFNIRPDCDIVTFHFVDFQCVVRFSDFDFIVTLLIVKIFTFLTTDYNDFSSVRSYIC